MFRYADWLSIYRLRELEEIDRHLGNREVCRKWTDKQTKTYRKTQRAMQIDGDIHRETAATEPYIQRDRQA